MCVTKDATGSTEWIFRPPYVPTPEPHLFDNCVYCPPMNATVRVNNDGDTNPYQKPQALYRKLVSRYSSENGVISEFTAGSGTLAAVCARVPELRDRTGTSHCTPRYEFALSVFRIC